jgi:hypothetical protein
MIEPEAPSRVFQQSLLAAAVMVVLGQFPVALAKSDDNIVPKVQRIEVDYDKDLIHLYGLGIGPYIKKATAENSGVVFGVSEVRKCNKINLPF